MRSTKSEKSLDVNADGRTQRKLKGIVFAVLGVLGGVFMLALVGIALFLPPNRSPVVDPEKKRLVEAARDEFEVTSDYELDRLTALPEEISDDDLSKVGSASVAVLICPERESSCRPGSAAARVFHLDHVVQFGIADSRDVYDFVFSRDDETSTSAGMQELRYRTWDGGGTAALVVSPTDWTGGLRRNQVARIPDFEDTDLAHFLYANHKNPAVREWGNRSGLARTCVGYCPAPTPSVRDRIGEGIDVAVAYVETEGGRNLILALCAIISTLAAVSTFLLKRAEFALVKTQGREVATTEKPPPQRRPARRATQAPRRRTPS